MQPTRRTLLGYGVLLACPSPSRADDLKDGRFRDEVVTILRGLYPRAKISVDHDLEQVHVETYTIYLSNLHADLRGATGAERRRRILAFLTGTMPRGPYPKEAPPPSRMEPFEKSRVRLRIQLVPPDYTIQSPDIVSRPFSKRLRVAYALDEPNRYQLVTMPMLTAWGIDAAALEGPAVENLESASKDIPLQVATTETGQRHFATVETGDGYDAARLLLPRFMEGICDALGSPAIVAAVPVRDLLMAWAADTKMRAVLAKAASDQLRRGPYARSDELFRFDKAGLRPLDARELVDHGR
ncbi:DUF1444 family protein [Methylobacterium nigriterrae]|uniref:DUF1444 family protein n=1 Tax=Methylobacterium nigriterrae TaxID=3127512 RepID=UPI0030132361